MLYHIPFQICGLILVTLILIMFFRHKTLHRTNEVAFSVLLLSVFLCITMDIASIFVLRIQNDIPPIFTHFICKFYLLTIIEVSYALLVYTFVEIYHRQEKLLQLFILYLFPLLTGTWIYITNPIYCYININNREIYTYGICVNATYIITFLYLLICLFYIVHFRSQISPKHRSSILFFIFSWTGAALIQFFHNEWLLVGFAMSLCIVFMYLNLENPEENLDPESGAFNPHAFAAYLPYLEQGGSTYSTITIMIDHYQLILETFGYRNYKRLFHKIAAFLSQQEGGRVFRSAESNFSLIFEQKEDMTKALAVIRQRFTKPWQIPSLTIDLSVSICYMPDSQVISSIGNSYDLIRGLITEKYKMGTYSLSCIDSNTLEQKLAVEKTIKALHTALTQHTIKIFYQPIYSIEKNRYTCAEALICVPDREGHYISPDFLIPLADENGMILELSENIFEQVCSFIHKNDLIAREIEYIEIHLSVIQCMKESLAKDLKQIMDRYEVPYSMINLKIKEMSALHTEKTLLPNMKILRELGVSFSLGDYTKGYNTLNCISKLPIQIVKLDKRMVWDYFENTENISAMHLFLTIMNQLGLKVVAEGSETQEQLQEMLRLKIDYVQGYFFSKPLSEKNILEALDKQF